MAKSPGGRDRPDGAVVSPAVRRLGLMWVCVSLPVVTAGSVLVGSPRSYLLAMILLGGLPYTVPALALGWRAVRRGPPADRPSYALIYSGIVVTVLVGLGILVGQFTGWRWGNALGVPAVLAAGAPPCAGVTLLVRSRSGHRALSVDVLEALAAVVAVAAPLVLLWGPAVVRAEASWFTVPAAVAVLCMVWGNYWSWMFLVRLGPGRGLFEASAVMLGLVGFVAALLHVAQGASGFTLPAPPLVALHALACSAYLLIPLYVPRVVRPGLARLPPQAQVRGALLPSLVTLGGLAALLVATVRVGDERSWAVPFALGVVSLLCGLGCLRQMAATEETRRLHGQVQRAAEERRRLLAGLLERAGHDRRRVAEHLYEQTVAAHTSLRSLAGSEANGRPAWSPSRAAVAATGSDPGVAAPAAVAAEAIRPAEAVEGLVQAVPAEVEGPAARRWAAPVRAYLASLYGDRSAPRLSVAVADDVEPSWIAETVLLHIAQEALRNVWRHSGGSMVDLAVRVDGDAVILQVTDDGVGFDPAAVPEGTGIATMRAAAAAAGGTLVVDAFPGVGVTVEARLDVDVEPDTVSPSPAGPPVPEARPRLRLVSSRSEPGR